MSDQGNLNEEQNDEAQRYADDQEIKIENWKSMLGLRDQSQELDVQAQGQMMNQNGEIGQWKDQ